MLFECVTAPSLTSATLPIDAGLPVAMFIAAP
jgi:hypothetical protein